MRKIIEEEEGEEEEEERDMVKTGCYRYNVMNN